MDELTKVYNQIFSAIQEGDTRAALESLQCFAAAIIMDSKYADDVLSTLLQE